MVKKIVQCFLFVMLVVGLGSGVYAMTEEGKVMRFEGRGMSEEAREKLKDMRAKKLTKVLQLDGAA